MIAVLSPAKTLDLDSAPPHAPTRARFTMEAEMLARSAARLSQKRLAALMHISPALAKLNAARFKGFADAPERPALYTFAGDVYVGLEPRSLDVAATDFAYDHLRLLSGLYGLLRPLDGIKPHRLEMGTRWAPRRDRLTDWWGGRIAEALTHDVAAEGSGEVLNLASQEYWAAVDGRVPDSVRVVAADFREPDGRFIAFYAKKARGMMARWLAEHRVAALDDMRGFDSASYSYVADESDATRWVFRRSAA